MTDVRSFVADQLWLLVAVVTLPVLVLAAMLQVPLGPEIATVIGWLFLTPLFLFWGDEIATLLYGPASEDDASTETEDDPIDVLKRRYARGEIDDEEFEARLDRLLEVNHETDRDSAAERTTARA